MSATDVARIDARLASALPAGALYAVGGRVRDEVRAALDGSAPVVKDLDYVVVGLDLAELVARVAPLGRADVVGAAFAVVKVTFDGVTVDVALPRRERSTGVGHRDFTVESGPDIPLEDDLGRRDFRMNMLARALPGGRLVDPYGGEADIGEGRIDVLHEAAFEEDPLRMLRAAQFAARFAYAVTPRTRAAMAAAAPLAATVSPERIREELVKLLGAERPSIGLEVMRETGLLDVILPEFAEGIGVEQNEWHAYDVYRHGLVTVDAAPADDVVLRLAAMLHDVGKPRTKEGPHFYQHEIVGAELAVDVLSRLRFANDVVERVERLVRNHMYSIDPAMSDGGVRRFLNRVGPENVGRQFALRHADIIGSGLPKRSDENERFEARVAELLSHQSALKVTDLPVDGTDVIAAAIDAGVLPPGSSGGRIVGEILRAVLERTLDDVSLGERETALGLVRALIYQAAGVESKTTEDHSP